MGKYDDMFHLSRPRSRYPKMRRGDRAKIFAPYDALKGFSDSVKEKDQVYFPRMLISDFIQEGINRRLKALNRGDVVTVIWFESARRNDNEDLGEYRTAAGTVLRVDEIEQTLMLDGETIPFEDIAALTNDALETTEAAYAYQ